MKKNKNIIIFVILLIVGLLVFVFKDKIFGANTNIATTPTGGSSTTSNFLLKYGSQGDQVRLLQAYLNEYYNTGLMVDGVWGDLTQAAFESFAGKVDFVASGQGITADEFRFIEPLFNYLSAKYFNTK